MWLHVLPGRARARIPGLQQNPRLAMRLEVRLANCPGVYQAETNLITGTLLIQYDPTYLTLDDLAACLHATSPAAAGEVVAARAEVAATVEAVALPPQPATTPVAPPPIAGTSIATPTVAPAVAPGGLTRMEVQQRQARYGPNVLQEPPRPSFFVRLLHQYKDVMQLTLVAGAGLSLVSGHRRDALTLGAVLLLNGVVGARQAGSGSRSVAALRGLSEQGARVMRDGQPLTVAAADLVPGDLLLLEAGDRLAADAQLLNSVGVAVDESLRTGECGAVEKAASEPLYAGTALVRGHGQAVVTATGMRSTLGQLADMLSGAERPAPLQQEMDRLGRRLTKVALWIAAGATGLSLLRGQGLVASLLSSVSLAISAVPEGLPTFVSLALAAGARQMRARQGSFKSLAAVETMGAVDTLCCDKTGTLTRGEMVVTDVVTPDAHWTVAGEGYIPDGEFHRDGTPQPADANLRRVLTVAALCTNARLGLDEQGALLTHGDPTELALLVVALKAGIRAVGGEGDRVLEVPFDAERRRMTVVCRDATGRGVVCVKGAVESILPLCTAVHSNGVVHKLDVRLRRRMEKAAAALATRGLRVLAVACRTVALDADAHTAERELMLLGLVGMADPPRAEAADVVARCQRAGVQVVMITGDHPATAAAIAREIGIPTQPEAVLTGDALARLSEAELNAVVGSARVVARVTPEQKLHVVRALRRTGRVVAMTGDGVNDAPALRESDVGIAMGDRGTDVTRATAGLILEDDNLQTVVEAIEQGRTTRGNVGRTARYLLGSNAAEVCLMGVSQLMGLPLPLLPEQLLWMNLVGDGMPATALGAEAPEPGIMRRPAERSSEISRPAFGREVAAQGVRMGLAAMAVYAWALWSGRGLPQARTLALATLSAGQIRHLFACRSRAHTPQVERAAKLTAALTLCAIYLPPLRNALQLAPLGVTELTLAAGVATMAGRTLQKPCVA